jgi:hypothetical protein
MRWHPDRMLLDNLPWTDKDQRVVFIGIDWERKDETGVTCPRCQELHCWRTRTPKRCRHCGLKFFYTANEAKTQSVKVK